MVDNWNHPYICVYIYIELHKECTRRTHRIEIIKNDDVEKKTDLLFKAFSLH